MEAEYAAKYLEMIGVNPSRENIELIVKNLPISDAFIYSHRDSVLILPGMATKAKECESILANERMR